MIDKLPREIYRANIKRPQETHAALTFLFDISDSMNHPSENKSIDRLNEAIQLFIEQAKENPSENNVIDVAAISFNSSVEVISEYKPLSEFNAPILKASGLTSMGAALEKAIEMTKSRVSTYREIGVDCHIPWIVLFTDGMPTDNITRAKQLLEEEKTKGRYGHLKLWIIATDEANLQICKELTDRVIYMKDKDYKSIFDWTRESMVILSNTDTSENAQLAPVPVNTQIVK